MAGTILDEQNVVYKTLHKSIRKFGYNISLEHVLINGAGKEKYQAIFDILSDFLLDPKEISMKIFSEFKIELDSAYKNLKVNPCKGAEKLFKLLKSKKIKVVFNTGYN